MRKIAEIIELIKEKKFLKTDADVSKLLGLKGNALYERKRTDSIPYEQIADFCARENISLDWLLLGRGDPAPADPQEDIEKRLARLEKLMKGKK